MSRKPLIRSKEYPYHVTGRVNNREDFPCPLQKTWEILCERVAEAGLVHSASSHALTLMPNHFHLLVSTPEDDLGVVMQRLVASFTKELNRISGRKDRIFGKTYYRTMIDSPAYFGCALKYVYRNPVRAGLVERVEDWPFSTIRGLMGEGHLPMPLWYPFGLEELPWLPEEGPPLLDWLNTPFEKEVEARIKKHLRRRVFSELKSSKTWGRRDLTDLALVQESTGWQALARPPSLK